MLIISTVLTIGMWITLIFHKPLNPVNIFVVSTFKGKSEIVSQGEPVGVNQYIF